MKRQVPKILIASSDRSFYGSIAGSLSDSYDIDSVNTGSAAFEKIKTGSFQGVIVDCGISAVSAAELIDKIVSNGINICILGVAKQDESEYASLLVKNGAYDYVFKPADPERLKILLKNGLEKIELQTEIYSLKNDFFDPAQKQNRVYNASPTMQKIIQSIERVINTESAIFISGESGTGKGVLARNIHFSSNRRAFPFRLTDCNAMSVNLVESELFGHEKGAFTGAVSVKTGNFEAADKGTLFIHEVGNISSDLQLKLLRVLREKEFVKVGGHDRIKLNARIIASSNRDIGEMLRNGILNEELYSRLNVVPVHLPPLRERREEIPLFIDYFLALLNDEYARDITIDIDGRLFLSQYDWPGNIRQLENIIRRIVLLSGNGIIGKDDVAEIFFSVESKSVRDITPSVRNSSYCHESGIRKTLAEIEREAIIEALESGNYNISEAAKVLGISRKTIHNKLKIYDIVVRKKIE